MQKPTLQSIALQPRWTSEQLCSIDGLCRGSLLKDWAKHCRKRFGPSSVKHIRDLLGTQQHLLPDEPDRKKWYPVSLQLQLTDILIEHFLDGDPLALEPMLEEDGTRAAGWLAVMMLKKLNPETLLKHTPRIHKEAYDLGQAHIELLNKHAIIAYRGSELFNNPTWQLLQCFALRILMKLTHTTLLELNPSSPQDQLFHIEMRWS